MNHQLLYLFHLRPRRYNYNSVVTHYHRYRGDKEFFNWEDAFRSFLHRIHGHHYNRDDDDDGDDNAVAEGDNSFHEYIDNFTKGNRARLGLPTPKERENPFKMG